MNSLIEENIALKKENKMLEGYNNEWCHSNHIYEQQQQKLEEEIKKLKKENERLISIMDECRDWVNIHRNETTGMVDNYELRQIEARLDGYVEDNDFIGYVEGEL